MGIAQARHARVAEARIRQPVPRQPYDGRVVAPAAAARGARQQQSPAAVERDRRRAAAADPPRGGRDARHAVPVEGRVEGARGRQPCGEEGGARGAAALDRRRQRDPAVREHEHAARAARELHAGRVDDAAAAEAGVGRAVGEQPHHEHGTAGAGRDRARQHELALGLQRHRLELRARRPDDGHAVDAEVRVQVAAGLQPGDREALHPAERDRARDEDPPVAEQRHIARARTRGSVEADRQPAVAAERAVRRAGGAPPHDQEAAPIPSRHRHPAVALQRERRAGVLRARAPEQHGRPATEAGIEVTRPRGRARREGEEEHTGKDQ